MQLKMLSLFLALFFIISCSNPDTPTPIKTKNVEPVTESKYLLSGARTPCDNCDAATTCWITVEIDGGSWTYAAPCGTGGEPPSPPPPPSQPFPTAPAMYCAPSTYPGNPSNGTVFKISTSGSTCLSPVYYYSCTATAWVAPVDFVYGSAPTTNLYNGLHYQVDYNGTTLTYVYLSGLADLSASWFYQVSAVNSTGCTNSSIILGSVVKSGYFMTLYVPSISTTISTTHLPISSVRVYNNLYRTQEYSVVNNGLTYTCSGVDTYNLFGYVTINTANGVVQVSMTGDLISSQ